ncbi:hypothetical protein [Streptomyces sp. NPDC090112]|uniref:hypothetical protein n=1 Tax=Streptomyces sp. NPDC090112 TaxID=3365949 RepID=UPI0038115415
MNLTERGLTVYENMAGPAVRAGAAGPAERAESAARVVAWLAARDEVEHALRDALGRPPSQRDDTVARMAEALRAAAQGLGEPAIAVAAGVPERMLRGWMEQDPAFATALRAASALAAGHGLTADGGATPAMLRVVLDAVGRGASWPVAGRLAGLSIRRFNRLRQTTPGVESLLEAAQRMRSRTARTARVAREARAARSGARGTRRTEAEGGAGERRYRLVRLDDPMLSPTE